MVRYGDAWGKPADIVWIVRDNKLSKGGGPFQWFHAWVLHILFSNWKKNSQTIFGNLGMTDVQPAMTVQLLTNLGWLERRGLSQEHLLTVAKTWVFLSWSRVIWLYPKTLLPKTWLKYFRRRNVLPAKLSKTNYEWWNGPPIWSRLLLPLQLQRNHRVAFWVPRLWHSRLEWFEWQAEEERGYAKLPKRKVFQNLWKLYSKWCYLHLWMCIIYS